MTTPLAPLPGTAPSLQDEVREAEAGRLRTVERENRELRGLLQVLQEQLGSQVGPSSILIPAVTTLSPIPMLPTLSLSHMSSAPSAGGAEQGLRAGCAQWGFLNSPDPRSQPQKLGLSEGR